MGDNQEHGGTRRETEQQEDSPSESPCPGESLGCTPNTYQQNDSLSEVCSHCQYCRETSRCELVTDSQPNSDLRQSTYFVVPPEGFAIGDGWEIYEKMLDYYGNFVLDEEELRHIALTQFHAQGGRWKNKYLPGERRCFSCLQDQEGWVWDESDMESDLESEVDMTYLMPGAFIKP
jgi:hypothetical protein